jgi:hypothetical protein
MWRKATRQQWWPQGVPRPVRSGIQEPILVLMAHSRCVVRFSRETEMTGLRGERERERERERVT